VQELVVAFVFAIICAVIVEVLSIGSALRAGVRHIRNKISERSASRLRKRIAQLETYRETINSYLSSDKALYLVALRFVLGILMLMCIGTIFCISSLFVQDPFSLALCSIGIFSIAAILALHAARIAGLDTRQKISALVTQLDAEIDNLKSKLTPRAE
jgi:hypothetical protein